MTDQITYALRDLGNFANGIIPSKISGPGLEPTTEDGYNFCKDLQLLAAKVDRVIEAYGEYLESNGVVSNHDVRDCFKDTLLRAIDGNATFCIENGIRERIQALREDAQ